MRVERVITGLSALAVLTTTCVSMSSAKPAPVAERRITVEEYRDRMKAGWIGQMAAVGLGGPTEFRYPGRIMPENETPVWRPGMINQFNQDDIYVEMTFLRSLEVYGLDVSIRQAGIDFARSRYGLACANAAGRSNLRRGIAPPDSSHPQFNRNGNDIDYQIEADYSGLIAPGMPNIPIELGQKFGRLMNYGDGVYAGQFVGGMYSEAFFENDPVKIIESGLRCIPEESQYAEMVRDMLAWYKKNPDDWQKTWQWIDDKYHANPKYQHGMNSLTMPRGKGDKRNIDAKLNGAYILVGLLYGKGDPDRTMTISMRCGQDSDCNPSNASGVLFTTMGFSKVPEKFKSALDPKGKFSHTPYDFPTLVAVCEKLARQTVKRSGGRVEKAATGEEVFVIPPVKPKPSKLERTWEPGPIANSRFTESELAKITFGAPDKVKTAAEELFPGWVVNNCGSDMNPGLVAEWNGKKNILLTHPFNQSIGCTLSRKIALPKGKARLLLTVSHHPSGDWDLIVKANGEQQLKQAVGKDTAKDGWSEIVVDLAEFAGKEVELQLVNQPSGWNCEAAYWGKITVVSTSAVAEEPAAVSADKHRRPNIVFLLADDLGYGDLGCYGQEKINTPRLDQMAAEGIRFTDHYSGYTVCSPSRCALMTGMHMGHASVKGNGGTLRATDVTVAMLLKQAGYKTCMIGKWGLVGHPRHPGSPNKKGFDHFLGFDNQGFAHFYYPEFLWRNGEKVLYPKNHNLRTEEGEYIPDVAAKGTFSHDELTKEALGWIKENKDNPFFLYLPFCIPHAELTVPPDSMEPYLKLGWPEKPKLVDKGNNGGGGYGSQYKRGYCGQSHPNAAYAGMVSRMDRSIGKILDLLDELKLADNTLVIFSSDNGPTPEGGQSPEFFNSNGPLSGGKRSLQEGGIRVPMIARWPGKIKPNVVSGHPSAFWDFLPTACEVAGIETPKHIDGISYLPELLGNAKEQKQHEYLYWIGVIRVDNWKLHRAGRDRYRLYDLNTDIAEKHNLAEKHPEVVARCSKYFDIARRKLPQMDGVIETEPSAEIVFADPDPNLRMPKVRISQLKPLKASTGFGQLRIGRSSSGGFLRLSGKVYKDGVGMHANGELVYACKPGWTDFVATVGLDDAKRVDPRASIVCKVIAEDKTGKKHTLAKTPVLGAGKLKQQNIDVRLPADCAKLHLVVDDAGDGIHCDHANWVNAGFREH